MNYSNTRNYHMYLYWWILSFRCQRPYSLLLPFCSWWQYKIFAAVQPSAYLSLSSTTLIANSRRLSSKLQRRRKSAHVSKGSPVFIIIFFCKKKDNYSDRAYVMNEEKRWYTLYLLTYECSWRFRRSRRRRINAVGTIFSFHCAFIPRFPTGVG